jgi:hypothetical protein
MGFAGTGSGGGQEQAGPGFGGGEGNALKMADQSEKGVQLVLMDGGHGGLTGSEERGREWIFH